MKQAVLASLPDGYGNCDTGYSFLTGCKSLKTGKVNEKWIFFKCVHKETGTYNKMVGPPLHKDVVAKFDIDWEAGTAKLKDS